METSWNLRIQGSNPGWQLQTIFDPGLPEIKQIISSQNTVPFNKNKVARESGWQSGNELDFYPSNPGSTPATKKRSSKTAHAVCLS